MSKEATQKWAEVAKVSIVLTGVQAVDAGADIKSIITGYCANPMMAWDLLLLGQERQMLPHV